MSELVEECLFAAHLWDRHGTPVMTEEEAQVLSRFGQQLVDAAGRSCPDAGGADPDVTEDFAIRCLEKAGIHVAAEPAVIRFEKNGMVLALWIEGDGSRSWTLEER